MLKTADLCVGYGKKVVISGVSFEVKAGQIVTLIGPNGSGKSTVLKTITGQLAHLGGSISVLGDVYKTDVFNLARYINCDHEIITINTIIKPPSAELHPGQQDSDSLPDYDTLDKILFEYIENEKDENALLQMGFDKSIIEKTLRLVKRCEFKRVQLCPALAVSIKPFYEREIPLISKF